jgi:hypothetical protein
LRETHSGALPSHAKEASMAKGRSAPQKEKKKPKKDKK